METHKSCGNVFSDIGFPPDGAASLLFRATLMARLTKITNDRVLTQHAAAKLVGVTQPRLNLLLKGKIGELSADASVNMLGRAGFTVEPRIVKTKTAA